MKGSSYSGLLERHTIHTSNVEHIVKSLRWRLSSPPPTPHPPLLISAV